jgi:hypothetical protein
LHYRIAILRVGVWWESAAVRLVEWTYNNARLTLALVVLLIAGSIPLVARLNLELDGRMLIPAGLREAERTRTFFESDRVVLIVVGPPNGLVTTKGVQFLAEIQSGLAQSLAVQPNDITSILNVPLPFARDSVLDYQSLAEGRLSISDWSDRLAALAINDGILFSRDKTATLITVPISDQVARDRVLTAIRRVASASSAPGWTVAPAGTFAAQAALGTAAANDLALLIPGTILVLGMVSILFFRSVLLFVFSLFEIGTAVLITAAVASAFGQPVLITTIVLPVVLLTVGLADDIYAISRFYLEFGQRGTTVEEALRRTYRAIAVPLIIPALVICAGLLSLTSASLPTNLVFGVYGALGTALSFVFTFVILPPLFRVTPIFVHRRIAAAANQRLWLGRSNFPSWLVFGLLTILLLLSAFGLFRLEINDSWQSNLPGAGPMRLGDELMRVHRVGGIELDFEIVAPSGMSFDQPHLFHAVAAFEERLSRARGVNAVLGPKKQVFRSLAGMRGISYESLERGSLANQEELSAQILSQSLVALVSSANPLIPAVFTSDFRGAIVRVFVYDADYIRIDGVLAEARVAAADLERLGAQVRPAGDAWLSYQTVAALVLGQTRSLAICIVTVFLIIWACFGSVRTALVVTAPVLLTIVVLYGFIGLADWQIGIVTALFAPIAMGIGIDFAVHLQTEIIARRQHVSLQDAIGQSVLTVGKPILASAVILTAGLAILLLSNIDPNRKLGFLLGLGTLVSAVATLVLVPALNRGLRT